MACGSVLQQINHGISTGALFLIVGVLTSGRHTRMNFGVRRPGDAHAEFRRDLFDRKPQLIGNAAAERSSESSRFCRGVSSEQGPGPPGGSLGVVLGAAYLLWLYQRVMFGPVTPVCQRDCRLETCANMPRSCRS